MIRPAPTPVVASRLVLLAALLAGVALGAGCGESPTAPGPAPRAVLSLTVAPNPITADTLPTSFQIRYTVTIEETAGVGGEFEALNSSLYDEATGALVGINNYDGADMIVFVGSKRLEPNASVDVSKRIGYVTPGGAKQAFLTVSVRFKDDRGNVLSDAVLVKVL